MSTSAGAVGYLVSCTKCGVLYSGLGHVCNSFTQFSQGVSLPMSETDRQLYKKVAIFKGAVEIFIHLSRERDWAVKQAINIFNEVEERVK